MSTQCGIKTRTRHSAKHITHILLFHSLNNPGCTHYSSRRTVEKPEPDRKYNLPKNVRLAGGRKSLSRRRSREPRQEATPGSVVTVRRIWPGEGEGSWKGIPGRGFGWCRDSGVRQHYPLGNCRKLSHLCSPSVCTEPAHSRCLLKMCCNNAFLLLKSPGLVI